MGLFNNHHSGSRIIINGHTVSAEELVDQYNDLSKQVDDLQEQLDHAWATLSVDGQQMTVDDVQDIIKQWQDATKKAKSVADQLAELKAENAKLRAAQSITIGDKPITIDELIDRYNDHLKQVRQLQDQVATLKDKNTELVKAAQDEQTLEVAGKRITIKELFDRYNGLLASYQDARNETHRLQIQQNGHAKSLMVNDQEMTADDVQKLIDQRETATEQAKSAADQIAELKSKNAELAKVAQSVQGLTINKKPVTIDEVIKKYNEHLDRLRQADQQIKQLKEQANSLTVNDQELTADDVQKLIDQRAAATEQVKSISAQLAELKSKNAQMAAIVRRIQTVKIDGKPATIEAIVQTYNEGVDRLKRSNQEIKQLQSQLKEQSTSLTVNGQEMTADDIQKLINQGQTAAEQAKTAAGQLTELKNKNTELAKTVDEMVNRYNNVLKQSQQAQSQIKQLKNQSASLKVNGKVLTAADVQKLIAQRQDAADQLRNTNAQLKSKAQELASAQQVTVNGKTMPVTELVKRYCYLLQQGQSRPQTNSQPTPQSQSTQPARSSAVPVSNADREKLIDRYYQDVQSVLGDYQDQVENLQQKLTKYLNGNGQAEFLQLAESKISANSYQKLFAERNKQMVRYIENHQYQEKLVRPEKQADNPHNELRGVDYWGNLIYRYRRALSRLLDQNKNVHHDFKYAYRYAKPTALQISERKPSYLTDQNVLDLRTIYSGIKDEQDWHKKVDDFRDQAKTLLKGAEGERIVRNVVKSYAYNRVLTSLNLPYEYQKGKADSNQIDCIVVNQKRIFILEIKNFNADTLGIDRDGFVVYYKKDGTATRYQNIARQGQNHYKAVQRILESDETFKPHIRYLKKYMRVVYVSTNPHAKLKPADPNAKHHYHFIGLDGLREYIDNTNGNLRPEIIQSVVDAIGNNQQAEKRYDHLCYPSDPVKRVDDVWQQLTIMNQLLKLKLDDFVDRYDPDIRQQLDMAGLVTRDGYVTSKPHHKKSEK